MKRPNQAAVPRRGVLAATGLALAGCATKRLDTPLKPDATPTITTPPPARDDAGALPPLHRAAARGETAKVRELLESGADPNQLEPSMSLSPLHKAAYSGSAATAEVLLQHGAIVDVQAPSIGDTPLHDAVAFRKGAPLDLIRMLLKHDASLAIRNRPGMTPQELAEKIGDTEVARLLADEARSRQPEAFLSLMSAVVDGDVARVRELLPGAEDHVNRTDDQGFAPLSRAARTGKTAIVALLLEHGANVNQLDRWMGAHAGHKAAFWGHADVLELLVPAGLSLDAQGRYNGYTALHDAVSQAHVAATKVLVEAGAHTDVVAHDGTTSLSIAESLGDPTIAAIVRGAQSPSADPRGR